MIRADGSSSVTRAMDSAGITGMGSPRGRSPKREWMSVDRQFEGQCQA